MGYRVTSELSYFASGAWYYTGSLACVLNRITIFLSETIRTVGTGALGSNSKASAAITQKSQSNKRLVSPLSNCDGQPTVLYRKQLVGLWWPLENWVQIQKHQQQAPESILI
jgi:hypothetical protein